MSDRVIYVVMFVSLMFSVFSALWLVDTVSATYDLRYVPTGSMWPTIPRGSIVLIEKNPFSLEVGDVVVYHYDVAPSTAIMHRIIGYDYRTGTAYIKGDNSTAVDSVPYRNIDGRVVLALPYAGFLRALLQEDPVLFAVIVIDFITFTILATEQEER